LIFFQAAIGGLALDYARKKGDATMIGYGQIILTMAVLSIIITAPIGAAAIAISGPRLLTRTVDNKDRDDAENPENDEENVKSTEM